MSEAKLKAEARRAKILARESTRLSVAKGETSSLKDLSMEPTEGEGDDVKKVRPLAARRNLVARAAESAEEESSTKAVNLSATTSTNGDEVPPEEQNKSKESETSSGDIGMTPKIVREVEQEVAQKTAEFDAAMLKKAKEASESKEDESEKQKNKGKKVQMPASLPSPLLPAQVMRFIRLLLIIVFGVGAGLYSSLYESNPIGASAIRTHPTVAINAHHSQAGQDILNSFLNANANVPQEESVDHIIRFHEDLHAEASWGDWAQYKLTRHLMCPISGVALVWWFASFFNGIVQRQFPEKVQKGGGNILSTIMSFYTHGLDGIMETVVATLGEIALYFLALVITACVLAYLAESGLLHDSTSLKLVPMTSAASEL